MTAAFAAVFGVFLTGCGDTPRAVVPAGVATRTLVDALGREVVIPASPQRVLALSEVDFDAMLALGAKPIGASAGRGQDSFPRYLLDQADGVELMGALYRPSLERVIAARPDLILCGGWMDGGVEKTLRKIAPVVRTYGLEDDWRVALRAVANALNLDAEAEAFEADHAARIAAIQSELGAALKKDASIVRWNPKGPVYMYADSFARKTVGEVGLGTPPGQTTPGFAHSKTISFERLSLIDADWIFLGTLTGGGEAAKAYEAARKNPAFAQLKAVKAGRVVVVDGSMWTSSGGPLAARLMLEEIHAALK